MRRIAMGTMAVAAVLFAAGLSAQGKPNFSGKWVREGAPAGGGAAAGGGGGAAGGGGGQRGGGQGRGGGGGGAFNCGMECTITQDGNTLKVSRAQGDQTITSEFNLAGDKTNQMPGRGGNTDVTTNGKWDGNKVVLTTKRDFNGNSITSVQTLSIEGGNLVVESSTDMGQGPQPGMKITYKKS